MDAVTRNLGGSTPRQARDADPCGRFSSPHARFGTTTSGAVPGSARLRCRGAFKTGDDACIHQHRQKHADASDNADDVAGAQEKHSPLQHLVGLAESRRIVFPVWNPEALQRCPSVEDQNQPDDENGATRNGEDMGLKDR